MPNFQKNQKVVKILSCAGLETGSIHEVEWVKDGKVKLKDEEHMRYFDKDGQGTESVLGSRSRLIQLEA